MKKSFLFFIFFISCCLSANEPSCCLDHPQIIFLRHGEAEHNLTNVYNSDPYSPLYTASNLTAKGRNQAQQIAEKLKAKGFNDDNIEVIYVSPLPRTLETSDTLAEAGLYSKTKVIIDLRLIETQFGSLEGAPEIQDPLELKKLFAENHVESNQHINERLQDFYNDAAHPKPCGNVIVITHAYNYKKLVKIIFNKDVEIPDHMDIEINELK